MVRVEIVVNVESMSEVVPVVSTIVKRQDALARRSFDRELV